ncbi:MAG: endopeptidase La [Lachnospiraceae bacterium]|nr:endopeptidase La [Lachnospiraceae bacterium]
MEKGNGNERMPAVALRGLIVMPDMIMHFDLSRKKSIESVQQAMMGDQRLFAVAQKSSDVEEPEKDDLYVVGTVAEVKQVTKLPNGILRVLVDGCYRARLEKLEDKDDQYLIAEITRLESISEDLDPVQEQAMMRHLLELYEEYLDISPRAGKNIIRHLKELENLEVLMNQIIVSMPLSQSTKQKLLETIKLEERYTFLAQIIGSETEISRAKLELSERIKTRVEKNQREYLLREQMNYIREELGDKGKSEADQFEEECEKLKASREVKEKIQKEIRRFLSISPSSSESAVERSYIETLLEMPWDKMSKDSTDIGKAEAILNADHYGLEQVKERILEFLAVRALTRHGDSPIICLVGPPGTGKTSIARSVARALNKKYVRISLGGIRDENEIRGHRRTYVGAMPGRIAAGLRQAGVKNPLMLLDEIDKVSGDNTRGDTAAALLEVLDSEQNNRFRDHYIELPVDLSEVLFIATANSVSTIPKPLLDRMELIEVTSYTANEKFHIAKEHLVKKQLGKNGLTREMLSISDHALEAVITGYTKEAGVRNLERKIGTICRKAAREILQKNRQSIHVIASNLEKYLGKPRYSQERANETDEVGIVRGLAWTSVGGDTLQIEVNMMPGKGEIELTGQMGDVMKESAKTGFSYIRSVSEQYHIDAEMFQKNDFHIHIPEGAVPKDGPSAGITMATAMLSVLTGIPVRADVVMTGEITLRGRVLPIGGLKEKTLAAKMAGVRTVLVPKQNEKDIEEIAKEIKSGLQIVFVDNMQEVIGYAFASEGCQEVEAFNRR